MAATVGRSVVRVWRPQGQMQGIGHRTAATVRAPAMDRFRLSARNAPNEGN